MEGAGAGNATMLRNVRVLSVLLGVLVCEALEGINSWDEFEGGGGSPRELSFLMGKGCEPV